jgi:hypothetical protein
MLQEHMKQLLGSMYAYAKEMQGKYGKSKRENQRLLEQVAQAEQALQALSRYEAMHITWV